MRPPKLYDSALRVPIAEAVVMARRYCADWTGYEDPNDPGRQLMELGARLVELLAERVNRVPEKNLLAFLDLVGVERSPGAPAEAAVTFQLSARSEVGQLVPVGTQVATTQSEGTAAQVFETRNSFFATPAQLVHVISLVPAANRFGVLPPLSLPPKPEELADRARAVSIMSREGPGLAQVEHALYLASSALFARDDRADITLEFNVTDAGQHVLFFRQSVCWQRFEADHKAWVDIEGVTYQAGDKDEMSVKFTGFPGSAKTEVAGYDGAWVVARLKTPPVDAAVLPVVGQIRGFIKMKQPQVIGADAAAINDMTADLSKPVFPFGERPKYGDAFHLASGKGFAPDVAKATIRFTLRPYTTEDLREIFANIQNDKVTTKVEWQYLTGGGEWKRIKTVIHVLQVPSLVQEGASEDSATTHPATSEEKNGALFGAIDGGVIIEFTLAPAADAAPGKIGGVAGHWVRAVLRSQHPYGRDGFVQIVQDNEQKVLQVVGPTFIPPVIEKIEIEYDLASRPIELDRIAVANNFEIRLLQPPSGVADLRPFVPLAEHAPSGGHGFVGHTPALYLGFDRKFGNVFVSLLVALEEPNDTAELLPETGSPSVVWEYATKGLVWKTLDIQDGTADMTTSGIVAFQATTDSDPLVVFPELTGRAALHWYRARLQSGTYATSPRLKAVLTNSVMTDNQETIARDWVLASGSGEPNQRATIPRRPVLEGEVWIREDELPSATERDELVKELVDRAVEQGASTMPTEANILSLRPGAADNEQEVWVRWLRVPNFQTSGPHSRHYTLEAATGEVVFGGITGGLIPPVGKDNIVVRGLRTGGGETSNRVAGPLAIKELKSSLPFIDKVFNIEAAVGGADPWTLERTFELGPQAIKNRSRAVTTEDYAWMTIAAFSQVARAKCLAIKAPDQNGRLITKPGAVSVIVVPKGSERTPQPGKGLLRRIEAHLRRHALGAIADDIHALPPKYHPVAIIVQVRPSKPEEVSLLEQRIIQALDAFFHPLTGGEQGQGWPFGRSVYISEVFAVIERTDGVDYVVDARFMEQPDRSEMTLGENELVASGMHQVGIV